jgi:hypothetical protein
VADAVEILIRARNLSQEAFRQAEKDLRELGDRADGTGTKFRGMGEKASVAGGLFKSMFGAFTLANIAANLVGKLTEEVQGFIDRGSKLPALETSFERLAKGAGENSKAMLASLSTATQGMVSNYDLMQTANKAMLLGLPVTAQSMGELAKAATTLGRAMGKDATSSLNDLITALGRSSPQILDNLGLTVKVGEANEAYARKLGTTADALTESEKKMAFYEAAMEAAREKTAELGGQTLTLRERVSQVWTGISNVVVDRVSDINVVLGKATASMKNFAAFLKDAAMFKSWEEMRAAIEREQDQNKGATRKRAGKADSDQFRFEELQRQAQELLQKGIKPVAKEYADLIRTLSKGGKSVSEITELLKGNAITAGITAQQVQKVVEAQKESTKKADEKREALKRLAEVDDALPAKYQAQVTELIKLGAAHGDIALKLGVSEGAVKNWAKSLEFTKDIAKTAGDGIRREFEKIMADVEKAPERLASGLKKANEAFLSNATAANDAYRAIERDSLEHRLALVKDEFDKKRAALDVNASNYRTALAAINAMEEDAARLATAAWQQHVNDVNAMMPTFTNIFQRTVQGIPKLIQDALTGGGGFGGGLKAILSGLGGDLGGRLFGDIAGKLSNTLFNTFGQAATQALGVIIPGLGQALGAAIGPLMSKVFGAFDRNKGRDLVKEFADKMGGFDGPGGLHAKLLELGDEGERLWIRLTQGVGRNNPEQARAAIAAIEEAFAKARDTAKASGEAQATAVNQALETAKSAVKALDDQIASLQQSIANEAPEEVMGVVEAQARARIAALEKERGAAQQHVEEVQASLTQSMDRVAEAIDRIPRDIEITVRTHFEGAEGRDPYPQHAVGAYVREDHTATVHAGEIVGPVDFMGRALAGAMRSMGGGWGGPEKVQVVLDSRVVGEVILRKQKQILASYGVRT